MGKRTRPKIAQIGQPRFRVRDAYKLDWVKILSDGAIAGAYGTVVSIFEPDGRLRVARDGYAKLYETEHILNPKVAIAPDGSALAYLGGDKLAIWSIADDKLLRVLKVKSPAWKKGGFGHDVRWNRNGIVALSTELTGGMKWENRTVFFWSTTFEPVIVPVNDDTNDIGFGVADDCTHCTVGRQLISLPDGKHVRVLEDHATDFALSDGAKRIVHCSSEEIDEKWVDGVRDERGTFVKTGLRAHSLSISPDGSLVAGHGHDGVFLVDFGAKKERFHKALGSDIEGGAIGKSIVAWSVGPRIVVLDLVKGEDRSAFEGSVGAVALSPLGVLIAGERDIRVLGDDGLPGRTIDANRVTKMVAAADVVFTCSADGLRAVDGKGAVRIGVQGIRTIDALAIADDGSKVAAGIEMEGERVAVVWSTKDGSELARSTKHPAPVEALALSGTKLATASSTSFDHGDMYGDGVKVFVQDGSTVIDEFQVDGDRVRNLVFEGDDLLITTSTRAFRRKDKKTSKLATPVILRATNGDTLRAKGDGFELWSSTKKIHAVVVEGQPVALDDKRILTALADGTFALYASR